MKKKPESEKPDVMGVLKLYLIGFAGIFAVSLPVNDIASSLRLSFFYILLFYGPFLPAISRIAKIGMLEKFFLSNLAGLTYAAVYVILDVILKIPLSLPAYLAATIVIYIISWAYFFGFRLKI